MIAGTLTTTTEDVMNWIKNLALLALFMGLTACATTKKTTDIVWPIPRSAKGKICRDDPVG